MADRYGIDLGNIYSQAESIKTARLNRKIAEKNAGMQEEEAGLRSDYMAGDEGAMGDLVALNPKSAGEFMAAIGEMDAGDRAEAKAGLDRAGEVLAWVLGSDDPASAYTSALSLVPEDVRKMLPDTYDEGSTRLMLGMVSEGYSMVDGLINKDEATAAEAADIRGEERAHRYKLDELMVSEEMTRETNRLKAEAEAASEGSTRAAKAADSNAIYRQASAIFGGIYSPDGEGGFVMTGLDEEAATKVAYLSDLASTIWMNNPSLGHANAVRIASDRLGLLPPYPDAVADPAPGASAAPGASGGPDTDPLKLR